MLFSSLIFIFCFLPAFLALYFIVPVKFKNAVLLFFSLIFYAFGEPVYVLLMIYSITVNFLLGRAMEKYPEKKKGTFVFTVIINLFILGFFKYYGFVIENINTLFHLQIPVRKIALPIGISFYTFQTLSYIIDLYGGRIKLQKNPVDFAAYITMFPQLIAGPIVRYSDVEEELKNRKVSFEDFGAGCELFLVGLASKVVLANGIGELFDAVKAAGENVTVLFAWMGAVSYTFQIYFDFCGYSLMAMGLGRMMGFHFAKNFDHPYISSSVTEFWRRWHISLGTWFREYVYIPLGGNRCKVIKHIRNILIVWLLTGLWHGASWNFVIWGAYYGILLLTEKYVISHIKIFKPIGHILTMFLVIIGWVIFSSDTIGQIGVSLSAMFGNASLGLCDAATLYQLKTYAVLIVLCTFFSLPFAGRITEKLKGRHPLMVSIMMTVMFIYCIALLVTSNYNPFLYFRF